MLRNTGFLVLVVLLLVSIAACAAPPTAPTTTAVVKSAATAIAVASPTLAAAATVGAAAASTVTAAVPTAIAGATSLAASPTPAAAATKPAASATGTPGAGGTSSGPSAPSATTVKVAQSASLGNILVDANGMTLYTFKNDQPGVSNCTGNCATTWPPLTVPSGTQPTAPSGVPGRLATIQRSDGGTQVTYDGMPLYRYAPDTKPGDTIGQGVGNVWFVVVIGGAGATPAR